MDEPQEEDASQKEDETRRELFRSWLTKAANDLKSARVLSGDPEGPLDTAIYHCQQCAEKVVKAFLVFKGITPRKTPDVRRLVLEASAIDSRFEEVLSLAAALTPYAWEFRYPVSETYPTRTPRNPNSLTGVFQPAAVDFLDRQRCRNRAEFDGIAGSGFQYRPLSVVFSPMNYQQGGSMRDDQDIANGWNALVMPQLFPSVIILG